MRCLERLPVVALMGIAPPLLALGYETVEATQYSRVDSAGVEIISSVRPLWDDADAWSVSPQPRVEIGAMAGEEPYLLSGVTGLVVLEDDRVAVAMMGHYCPVNYTVRRCKAVNSNTL